MAYEVEVVEVQERLFATLHGSAPFDDPLAIEAMVFAVSDLVALFIQEFDVPFGACIVRYDSAGLVEVGYEVFGDIPDAHGVFLSRIPAGWAAKTPVIVGSYQEMLEARRVVTDWCAQAGQALTGDSWSVDSKTTSALFFRVREGQ